MSAHKNSDARPVETMNLPAFWGSATDHFPGCIEWVQRFAREDGPRIVGSYFDGTAMRQFEAYLNSANGAHATIELPKGNVIHYTESDARLMDHAGRQTAQYIRLSDNDGKPIYKLEWVMKQYRSNNIYATLGATTDAVWTQCRRMAFAFANQVGASWLADMGGKRTINALRRLAGGPHRPAPKELIDLALYLRGHMDEYAETYVNLIKDFNPSTLILKPLKKFSETDYKQFIGKCREYLDVLETDSSVRKDVEVNRQFLLTAETKFGDGGDSRYAWIVKPAGDTSKERWTSNLDTALRMTEERARFCVAQAVDNLKANHPFGRFTLRIINVVTNKIVYEDDLIPHPEQARFRLVSELMSGPSEERAGVYNWVPAEKRALGNRCWEEFTRADTLMSLDHARGCLLEAVLDLKEFSPNCHFRIRIMDTRNATVVYEDLINTNPNNRSEA